MRTISNDLYGEMTCPESISELLELVKGHREGYFKTYFWRGQSNIEWNIHSSAYRRLFRTEKVVTEKTMQEYEQYLLNHATHQGYRYDFGRELKDLELLGKLQHHGAATRLIDVSRNLLVGLWFACSSNPDKYGLLFGFHSDYVLGMENRVGKSAFSYKEVFKEAESYNHVSVWHPPVVSKRIASQNAQFLYSKVVDGKFGSLNMDENSDAYLAINISPNFKKKAIKDLSQIFDIRALTLFPDIDGFGHASSFQFDKFQNERW